MTSNDDTGPGRRSGNGTDSLRAHIATDERSESVAKKRGERGMHSVLVVDDNWAARYAIARSLRAGGFIAVEAAAGLDALELVAGVSAMVLDLHLPDVDGMEVCRLVRGNPATSRIPIVHVSAVHLEAIDMAESASAGADEFLPSPIHPERLLAVLDELLSRPDRSLRTP